MNNGAFFCCCNPERAAGESPRIVAKMARVCANLKNDANSNVLVKQTRVCHLVFKLEFSKTMTTWSDFLTQTLLIEKSIESTFVASAIDGKLIDAVPPPEGDSSLYKPSATELKRVAWLFAHSETAISEGIAVCR